jgi:hypothetical protein
VALVDRLLPGNKVLVSEVAGDGQDPWESLGLWEREGGLVLALKEMMERDWWVVLYR